MKKFLLFLFLLILVAVAYLTGSRGTDPAKWFLPPTPTPTMTFTSTYTATFTATATFTFTATATPTATMTSTPVPKKKKMARKPPPPPPKKKKGPPPAPILPPEPKPICNGPALSGAVIELEPNNTLPTAQSLGDLNAAGLQVNGTLSKNAGITTLGAAEGFKIDPKVENPELDVDVYSFTTSTPFLVVLDCYTHVVGRPNPLYEEANFQLEVFDESFVPAGSSLTNDPVEAVELSEPGKTYYVAVYGLYGKNEKYRLTITRK